MARAVYPRARKAPAILCLPPATGDLPDGGVVVSSPAQPRRKPIEHAGHAYQQRLRAAHCTDAAKEEHAADAARSATAAGKLKEANAARGAVHKDEHALKRKLATDADDLYELLELGDKRWHATADEIKKSFRRISLLYHPDKLRHRVSHLGDEAIAETENHFKKVMKAYDILSDKKKRASYDSIDDVDDTIPSEKEVNDANFYKKMGACFALNARWSTANRVPELGDENTPIEKVNHFYDFWYSFKTWRDFSFDVEYNTDQAECREEKRWMERQNAKHVKGRKLEENARMRRLVDLGYKKDPRIRREKEQAKAKKEAQKEARRKQREEAEELKRAEAEKARLEAERKVQDDKEKRAKAKKEKDAARKVMRKARQKLRGVSRDLDLSSDVAAITAIEKMCSEGDVAIIEAFADKLTQMAGISGAEGAKSSGTFIANVPELVDDVLANGIRACATSTVSATSEDSVGSTTSEPGTNVEPRHSPEDMSNVKCSDQSSAQPIRVANGEKPANGSHARTKPAANGVKPVNGSASSTVSASAPWTEQEMSLLSKGVAKFPGGMKNRWERLAHYVGTRSEQEVLAKVNAMRTSRLQNGKNSRVVKASDAKKSEQTKPGAANGDSTSSARKPVKEIISLNRFAFTAKQQKELERAMTKYSSSLGANRWVKIAAEVNGRTAIECEERFKELVSYYKAKKNAAT